MEGIIDIHCHPTLHQFAFYNVGKRRKNDLWWDNSPRARERNNQFPAYFQSNMPALAQGKVKIIVAAMYAIEQNWFDPAVLGTGDLTDFLAKNFAVHIPTKYINKVQSNAHNYFNTLQAEFEFLKKDNGVQKSSLPGWKYVLPQSAEDIQLALSQDKTVVIIPSIEGGHSLLSGNNRDILDGNISIESLVKNVETVKSWSAKPLYLTLAHHFYNGLCGHAKSIPSVASKLITQQIGLNEPINDIGMELIDALLGINKYKHHTKRILIDTKHLSIAARMQYHEKISHYNRDKSDDEKIPILNSHAGYGGHKTLSDSIVIPDNVNDKYKHSTEYNPWSINLSDQEVVEIFKSNGLIGINLDQRILSGHERLEEEKHSFSNRDIRKNTDEVKQFWTKRVASNILGIVGAIVNSDGLDDVEKQNAWDVLCLGTDFDGMINPVDSFITSGEFNDLKQCLIKYMPEMEAYQQLSLGKPIHELVEKIMIDNAMRFILSNY